ncbi:MAG TPA: hypothetical protein VGF50_00235 [Caulobacteraceae bacterium]|jgi:hypothetical protein
MVRRIFAGLVCTVFASQAIAADAVRQLTDADLVAYAAKPFDKGAMMFHRVALGLHHGAPVVADFMCGDVCPDYTVRIIHYDLPPGPACARIGGVDQARMIPQGIAVSEQHFCVPAVLANRR